MPRKHRVAPPEQKLIEGNTPMNRSPNGRSYPMTEKQIEGRKRGGFQPGTSGNPKGRPRDPVELKTKISYIAPDAVDKVVDLMNNSDNAMVQLKAAMYLLDTQISKAATKQEIEIDVTHTSDFLLELARSRNIELPMIDVTPNKAN